MATILQLPGLRPARQRYKLTLTQAASALGITPSALDNWERGVDPRIDTETACAAYEKYIENTEQLRTAGKNVLFGCFPLRVARDILQLDIGRIAAEFGYSQSYWTKIEANARVAPDDVIRELETRVRTVMGDLCGFT